MYLLIGSYSFNFLSQENNVVKNACYNSVDPENHKTIILDIL